MGEKFANYTSDKGLISKIYKLTQLDNKKTIQLKNGQRTQVDTLTRKTYRQPTDTRRCSVSLVTRGMQIKTQ